jgi:hypothetical protein
VSSTIRVRDFCGHFTCVAFWLGTIAIYGLFPRAAGATSIVYPGLGEARLARIAVTGTGPAWANSTIWAEEYKWRPASGAAGYDIYDPSSYAYSMKLQQEFLDARTVTARSSDVLTPTGVPGSDGQAVWHFNSYAPGVPRGARSRRQETTEAQSAIELQVAIWTALLESSNDVLSGTLKLNAINEIKSTAMAYLASLFSDGPSGYDAGAATWLDPDRTRNPIDLTAVRKPGPLVLLAAGLGLTITLRRVRRTTRSH